MSLERLLAWNQATGQYFGSEDQSIFFYAYTKMQRPTTVLELGTGLGHTALWIAQALKENRTGHVWTVDNGARWPELRQFLVQQTSSWPESLHELFNADLSAHGTYMRSVATGMGLDAFVTFLVGTASLTETATSLRSDLTETIPNPIDLLYADFDHYPHAVLTLLVNYLPLMSEAASIFIDSASTYLASYLVLQLTIDQLNHGKIPAIFRAGTTPDQRQRLSEIVATKRFTLLPMVERKDRNQNGLAWIRMEPVNVVPYPLTQMRGFFSRPLAGAAVEAFFADGHLPDGDVRMAFLFEQFVRAAYGLSEQELQLLLALLAGRKENAP